MKTKFEKFNENQDNENYLDTEQGNCYVFVQGNDINEEHYFDLVRKSKNDLLILYPERGMRFVDVVDYRPFVKSIVTENPYIISSYPVEKVFILKDDEWINPSQQTYGASVNLITNSILNYHNTIPSVVNGGKSFASKIKDMKNYD